VERSINNENSKAPSAAPVYQILLCYIGVLICVKHDLCGLQGIYYPFLTRHGMDSIHIR